MRKVAALWRIALVPPWLGALAWLASVGSGSAVWYLAIGAPLTVLVGAIVDRWWIALVPLGATTLALVVALGATAVGPTACEKCGDVDGWVLVIISAAVVFTIPASAALAVGVGVRRVTDPLHGRPERALA
jgi:hypothetical protein